jgi:arylsulfatase A-like enzyme
MNVVVIAAHGLNCHWLGPYGNEWISTQAFDQLACEAITFDRHFANDPLAARLLQSDAVRILNETDVLTIFVDDCKPRRADDRPWRTTVVTSPVSHRTPGDALLTAIASAVEKFGDRPWLLWVETDRLLPPWDFEFETYQQYAEESAGFIEERTTEGEEPIDEPVAGSIDLNDDSLRNRLHNSFAAAVTSFDAELAALTDLFRQRGFDRSATWVFTSAYGWPLGEHGVVGPVGSRLHEELIHLPLMIRLPDGRERMRRVANFTQTVDLGPTILDLLSAPRSAPSLVPLLTGTTTGARDLCRISTDSGSYIERALRTADWAYLAEAGGQPARLYRKPDDIWEVNDLSLRYPDDCDQLLAILNQKEQS